MPILSKNQEKLIKSLQTKKGREKSGFCLIEGQKVIDLAGDFVEYSFSPADSENYADLVTTETPQDAAAVARIPESSVEALQEKSVILVLDGVQDPGNIGAILRLCLAFNASLVLIESADVSSPKVIRSSVGAMFQVPWMQVKREDALEFLTQLQRPIYRLEKREGAKSFSETTFPKKLILVAGSEGQGIYLEAEGESVYIDHSDQLESLNVGNAIAIALQEISRN